MPERGRERERERDRERDRGRVRERVGERERERKREREREVKEGIGGKLREGCHECEKVGGILRQRKRGSEEEGINKSRNDP